MTSTSNKIVRNQSENASRFAKKTKTVPVVGIGASAGGLEAFESFFSAMPSIPDLTFVLIAHLSPNHASLLPEIIQKKTRMVVQQAVNHTRIQANEVYVIPPNHGLTVHNGTLQLSPISHQGGMSLPIDVFFRSLAQDLGSNAIGVILSGTGADGTLGLRSIKEHNGMIMVQDPKSARYSEMPENAIETGLVDYVLPAVEMPLKLLSYVQHAAGKTDISENSGSSSHEQLSKIFTLLQAHSSHDFSLYKKKTMYRRIERRMHVKQIDRIGDYVQYLQDFEQELSILFKELLIGVTRFFREETVFALLKDKYIPEILAGKRDGDVLRIWVPGCSRGEEAYSIAIVVHECMENQGQKLNVQIFGTDIDDSAVNLARTGLYPATIATDISGERLTQFFTKEDDRFRIIKRIREMVVFAVQNVIKDPPFTKLDMISCRNLLIYFNAELQKKLFPLFHYGLLPNGLLLLGVSETIGTASDLFSTEDKKWKIFKHNSNKTTGHLLLSFPSKLPQLQLPSKDIPARLRKNVAVDTLQLLKSMLKASTIPACIVIDDQADIVYIHGRTGRFLEQAEGETSINALEMARPGLRAALFKAIRIVTSERHEVVVNNIQVNHEGGVSCINLIAKPISDFRTSAHGLTMIFFEDVAPGVAQLAVTSALPDSDDSVIRTKQLEDALQFSRDNLQATIEALQIANEELKTSNEELQSTNEELQSTNEELETSKEELQSLNEESTTVNAELQNRIDELSNANDDIKNLFDSINIATLFLDTELCIRRFTQSASEIVPLLQVDSGRPIKHFATSLPNVDLAAYGTRVLTDLSTVEEEVCSSDGKIYHMKMRPYRTITNIIDGVVVTFENISARKQLEYKVEARRSIIEAVLEQTESGIVACDADGKLIYNNSRSREMLGLPESPFSQDIWTRYFYFLEADGKTRMNTESTPVMRALQGERIRDLACIISSQKGSTRQILANCEGLADSKGDNIGTILYIKTVSTDFKTSV